MPTIRDFKKGDPTKGFVVGKTKNNPRKWFKTLKDAELFVSTQQREPLESSQLFERKNELLRALERCQEMGVELDEVLDFYARHGAKRGTPTLANVVSALVTEKEQANRSEGYIADLKVKFSSFGKHVGADTKIADITADQISDYIYEANSGLNEVSKLNHIRVLAVLFNYAEKKRFISFNPVSEITKPKKKKSAPKIVTPEDFTILLNRCLKRKWHDRLAVFVMVGFCGVRMEEASKLNWADINLSTKKVRVSEDIAKLGSHRIIPIPVNAMAWLKAVHDARRTGPIITPNWKNLCRSAIRFSHINCPKNSIRHSYCSYALAAGWALADVIAWMGHNGSPAMINRQYRELVETEAALKFWGIRPSSSKH